MIFLATSNTNSKEPGSVISTGSNAAMGCETEKPKEMALEKKEFKCHPELPGLYHFPMVNIAVQIIQENI